MIAVGHLARCTGLRELRPNRDCHMNGAREISQKIEVFLWGGQLLALGAQKFVQFSRTFLAKCYGQG